MELQPLTNSTHKSEISKSKNNLRRMPHVWSDELVSDHNGEDLKSSSLLNKSKERHFLPSTSSEITVKSHEVIGEGLPLLQRLKLLKQKNDRELKTQKKPPISRELTSNESKNTNIEVIGAGLPLLQRLKLLKQKTDRELKLQKKTPVSPELTSNELTKHEVVGAGLPILERLKLLKQKNNEEIKTQNLPSSSVTLSLKKPTNEKEIGADYPLLQKIQNYKRKSQQELVPQNKINNFKKAISPKVLKNKPNIEYNGKLKIPHRRNTKLLHKKKIMTEIHTRPKRERINTKLWMILKNATVLTPKTKLQNLKVENEIQCDSTSFSSNLNPTTENSNISNTNSYENNLILMCQTLDDQYKQGSLIAQNISAYNNLYNKCTENNTIKEQCDIRIMQRPKIFHLNDTKKSYKSINDLSPKYAGLSFVKKLKILNERQKRAELEKKYFSRSCSLDFTGCKNLDETNYNQINRSNSETVALEVILRNQKLHNPNGSCIDDSNETAERIRLKKILKQLSSNDNNRINHLMASQTIEGYAARHSKLTRNVTINQHRTIIRSSPDTCNSLFTFPTFPKGSVKMQTSQCNNPDIIPFDLSYKTDIQESSQTASNINLSKRISPIKLISRSSIIHQDFSDEILNGVKTVIEKYLNDLEDKYQNKIDELESEINKRDYTISILCEQFNQKLSNKPIDERKLRSLLDIYSSKSFEEEEDHPFIRNESVDTVMSPFNCLSPLSVDNPKCYHPDSQIPVLLSSKSWENQSGEEHMELQDLPKSIIPEPSWRCDDTRIDMNCTDDEEEGFLPRWDNWETEMLMGHTSHTNLHNMVPGLLSRRSLDENSMIMHKEVQEKRKCLSIDNLPFSNSILRNFGQYVRLNSSSQTPSPEILPTISKSCFSLIPHSEN